MYCTTDDLIKACNEQDIIDLTDDDNLGLINENIVNSAIASATDEINGYLGTFMQLPLSEPIPGIIKNIAVSITLHNLYARKSIEVETIEKKYDKAVKLLEMLACGKIKIGTSNKQQQYKWVSV